MQDRPSPEKASKTPSQAELVADWERCTKFSSVSERTELNINARTCWWPGQSSDGRKWAKRKQEKRVFPWKGASDSRPHFVDTFVNEDVALLMLSWRRAKLDAQPTEAMDAEDAGKASTLLRWQKNEQISEGPIEAVRLANLFLERGKAVLANIWCREHQLARQTLSLVQIVKVAQDAAQRVNVAEELVPGLPNIKLAQMPEIVQDPLREEEAIAIGMQIYPDAIESSMRSAIKDLRKDGEGTFLVRTLVTNRPKWRALAIGEDIFLPPGASTIDNNLPCLHWREELSETSLRDRIQSHDWDKGFVGEVIKTQKGKRLQEGSRTRRIGREGENQVIDDGSEMFEVLHTYRRQFDSDNVPGLYCTVWHPGLTSRQGIKSRWYGYHELVNYDHGQYPFIMFQREYRSRDVEESRGYGEIAGTWQDGVKVEWDSRRDRNALTTVPPAYHPPGEDPYEWGPGAQIGTITPDAYGFFKGPGWDPGSKEMEKTIERHANRYFGNPIEDGSNAVAGSNIKRELVANWLWWWKVVLTQVLQLDQQFMDDVVYARIVGDEQSAPIRVARDEIQGKFNVAIDFNVDDLDPQVREKTTQTVVDLLKIDRDSAMDTTEIIRMVLNALNPTISQRVVKSVQQRQDQEIDDEQNAWSKMASGIPVDVKIGENYQLRLQWIQNQLTANPIAAERYQKDPAFKELLDRRIKQLSHQIQQYGENAQRGRLGA